MGGQPVSCQVDSCRETACSEKEWLEVSGDSVPVCGSLLLPLFPHHVPGNANRAELSARCPSRSCPELSGLSPQKMVLPAGREWKEPRAGRPRPQCLQSPQSGFPISFLSLRLCFSAPLREVSLPFPSRDAPRPAT